MSSRSKHVVGIGWYSADQWTMLKLTADDSSALDSSYEAWLAQAERTFAQVGQRTDIRAVKVHVDVHAMRQWCLSQGRPLDAPARADYLAETVRATEGGQEA